MKVPIELNLLINLNYENYYHRMINKVTKLKKIFKNNYNYDIHYLKNLNEDPIKYMQIKDINNYLR